MGALPPLRERVGDVVLLAPEFLRRNAVAIGKELLIFGSFALRALEAHAWPGNVRELENRVKRAVIMAGGKRIRAEDLEVESALPYYGNLTLKEARECAKREVVQRALRRHCGKIAPAAIDLGISRPTLYKLMEKLGLGRFESEGTSTGNPQEGASPPKGVQG